jgi:hypothetical protein
VARAVVVAVVNMERLVVTTVATVAYLAAVVVVAVDK